DDIGHEIGSSMPNEIMGSFGFGITFGHVPLHRFHTAGRRQGRHGEGRLGLGTRGARPRLCGESRQRAGGRDPFQKIAPGCHVIVSLVDLIQLYLIPSAGYLQPPMGVFAVVAAHHIVGRLFHRCVTTGW
ncbi:hypothetical protein MYX82_14700, partial [Acidobacteria bacterium AH-259-D05]|nr:hypothetical protein [Acidobacteria bacterium AH-259-D05]